MRSSVARGAGDTEAVPISSGEGPSGAGSSVAIVVGPNSGTLATTPGRGAGAPFGGCPIGVP